MTEAQVTEANGSETSELGAIEAETTSKVGENRKQLQENLSKIRSNADLSESAKQRYAEQASREASARHAEIVSEFERQSAQALEESEQAVFGLSYPHTLTASEKVEFRQAYRDAAFRTLDLEPEQLERVMARAQRTGDRALQLACYHESVDRGLFTIADEYRDRNPDAKSAWERYTRTRIAAESNSALLGRALLANASPSEAEE